MTEAATTQEPLSTSEGGGYVVLRQDPSGYWTKVKATMTAKHADAAIRQIVGTLAEQDQSGTFVAVPWRSWRPVNVERRVTSTLDIKEAST